MLALPVPGGPEVLFWTAAGSIVQSLLLLRSSCVFLCFLSSSTGITVPAPLPIPAGSLEWYPSIEADFLPGAESLRKGHLVPFLVLHRRAEGIFNCVGKSFKVRQAFWPPVSLHLPRGDLDSHLKGSDFVFGEIKGDSAALLRSFFCFLNLFVSRHSVSVGHVSNKTTDYVEM